MKFKILNLFAGLTFIVVGCNTELDVETPAFDVSVESTTVQAGQEVYFSFTGTADNIYFYSGELLKDYAYKDGRLINVADSGAVVSFTSAVTGGVQQNQLSVLYSTNFDGNYDDLSKVKAATWTDITSSFNLGTNATFLASGSFDISELLIKNKPICFAFKYITKPQQVNGLARTWMIQNFTVTSKGKLGPNTLTISDQWGAGFRIIDEKKENAPAQSVITSSRITLLGNIYKNASDPGYDPNSPFNDPLSENWAVSTPIYVNEIDLGPDLAKAIKSKDTQSKGYGYTFSQPGTYQVYFVASNNSIDFTKEIVKKFEIIVTE